MKLVKNLGDIKLAMLGMVEGNGHPYSWSAIFNSYDCERMAATPCPGIAEYIIRPAFVHRQAPRG